MLTALQKLSSAEKLSSARQNKNLVSVSAAHRLHPGIWHWFKTIKTET